MTRETITIARAFANDPFYLAKDQQTLPFVQDFYRPLTPFVHAITCALFALTNDRPDDWQEVTASELLETLEIAKRVDGGTEDFHGQHYQDAFRALETLFRQAIPLHARRLVRSGRRMTREDVVRVVRLIEGFQLTYHDDQGNRIQLDDERFERYRDDIAKRRLDPKAGKKRERKKGRDRSEDASPVWALVRLDAKGKPVRDQAGRKIVRLPVGYGFRWTRTVVDDLLMTPTGQGILKVNKAIFRVFRNLRHANNGRGSPTATRLFMLIIADFKAVDMPSPSQILDRPAKRVFEQLGFADAGNRRKAEPDGRWSENVARVEAAVRLLKAEGVLLPESDEQPRVDPNPDRRKAPFYHWKRSKDWTFTAKVQIGEPEGRRQIFGEFETLRPTADQPSMFAELKSEPIRGSDIKAAREAAGMTLRDFARRFGKSIDYWSKVEREQIARRTGKVRPIPADIRDQVEVFVREHSGRKEGGKE